MKMLPEKKNVLFSHPQLLTISLSAIGTTQQFIKYELKFNPNLGYSEYVRTTQTADISLFVFSDNFGIQLPIPLGGVSLIPYAGAGISIFNSMDSRYDSLNIGYNYFYGAELYIPSINLGFGAQSRGCQAILYFGGIVFTVPTLLVVYAKLGL